MTCTVQAKFAESTSTWDTERKEWILTVARNAGLTISNAERFDVVDTRSVELPLMLLDPGSSEDVEMRVLTMELRIVAILGEMTVYSCDNYLRGFHFAYVTNCTEKTVPVPQRKLHVRYSADDISNEEVHIMRSDSALSSKKNSGMQQTESRELKETATLTTGVSLAGGHKWLNIGWKYNGESIKATGVTVTISRQFTLTSTDDRELWVWPGLTWRPSETRSFGEELIYDGFSYEPAPTGEVGV